MLTQLKNSLNLISADLSEVRYEETTVNKLSFQGKEIEDAGTSFYSGGCIRVYNQGGWGFVSFTNPQEIKNCLNTALRQSTRTKRKKIILKKTTPLKEKKLLNKRQKETLNIPFTEKIKLFKKYNDLTLKVKGISSTSVGYREIFKKKYLITSEGTEIYTEILDIAFKISAIAKEGNNVQVSAINDGTHIGYNFVQNLESQVIENAKNAVALLKAEPVKGGRYTVICDPKVTGLFAHEAFGHLAEADHLYEDKKLQKLMKLGKRFGPDYLNIVDDGSLLDYQGGIYFDDEGVPSQKNFLVKNGIFNQRLNSRETATILHDELTGNARALNFNFQPIVRMTNTFVDKGGISFKEMLESVSDGLYVVGDRGGQTNTEMFVFTVQQAYQIKNGKIGKLLRDVTLSGNVFETLNNVKMIGDEVKLFGGMGGCGKGGQVPLPVSLGGPHLLIENLIVGGK